MSTDNAAQLTTPALAAPARAGMHKLTLSYTGVIPGGTAPRPRNPLVRLGVVSRLAGLGMLPAGGVEQRGELR